MPEQKQKYRKPGKYTEWLTEDGLLQIEGWARHGLTDQQISHNCGCSYTTFKEWKKKYASILAAIKKGRGPALFEVENAMYKSARGYFVEEITQEIDESGKKKIKKTKRWVNPVPAAQIFILKNRAPDYWKDKPVDLTIQGAEQDRLEGFKKALDSVAPTVEEAGELFEDDVKENNDVREETPS